MRKELGAAFFSSSGSGFEICPQDIYELDEENKVVSIGATGSMMPFASSSHVPKTAVRFLETSKDHPSVMTWELLPDGTCMINQACVIASFKPNVPEVGSSEDLEPLRARIWAHDCRHKLMPKDVDLRQFLQEHSPDFNMYAVMLCHGRITREWSGVLLQEVVRSRGLTVALREKTKSLAIYQPRTKLLLRVGVWRLWDFKHAPELPGCRAVDWRIL